MNLPETIKAIQREVGLTGSDVDGRFGPDTAGRTLAKLTGSKPTPLAEVINIGDSSVSARSEKVILTLLPDVQPYARALISSCAAQGIKIEVISGLRSYAEQNALYANGRTAPGGIVTNAKGGQSNHNFGISFDIGVFQGGKYIEESPAYKAVGAVGKGLGLEWGGNWKTIVDEPHFQLRPKWAANLSESQMLAELRKRHDSQTPVFA